MIEYREPENTGDTNFSLIHYSCFILSQVKYIYIEERKRTAVDQSVTHLNEPNNLKWCEKMTEFKEGNIKWKYLSKQKTSK